MTRENYFLGNDIRGHALVHVTALFLEPEFQHHVRTKEINKQKQQFSAKFGGFLDSNRFR